MNITPQELEIIMDGLERACDKCERFMARGKRMCRNCEAEEARKIANQVKGRNALPQKERTEK